ncbi:hypothetical protein [Catenulispora rubra]|uniref:hypothetical protein n=1 Tax=Catenulispora rubra TaxID=280293 RepID=UPI0018927B9C|nr:hypothetical protein [Catenulispora rubra]
MTAKYSIPGAPIPLIRAARDELEAQLAMFKRAPEEYFKHRPSNCPNSTELAFFDLVPDKVRPSQHRLWMQTLNLTRLLATNVYDHVNSLRNVLSEQEIPLFAHLTIGRPACESTATIMYLLDTGIGAQTRLTRGSALLYADAKHQTALAAEYPPAVRPQMEATAQKEFDQLKGEIDAAAITVEKDKSKKDFKLVLGHHSALMKPNLTKLVTDAFPDRPGAYRITSGAIHGSHQTLNALTTNTTADQVMFQADLAEVGALVSLAIEATGKTLAAFAAYYGVGGEAEARATLQRVDIMNGHIRDLRSLSAP